MMETYIKKYLHNKFTVPIPNSFSISNIPDIPRRRKSFAVKKGNPRYLSGYG